MSVLGLHCFTGFSLVVASGGYSLLQCTGFSLWWLLLLRSTGSRHLGFSSCGSWALERRLSSCGTWAQLLRGMWDLPGPGLEPLSPALAGGFPTPATSGKPKIRIYFKRSWRGDVEPYFLSEDLESCIMHGEVHGREFLQELEM